MTAPTDTQTTCILCCAGFSSGVTDFATLGLGVQSLRSTNPELAATVARYLPTDPTHHNTLQNFVAAVQRQGWRTQEEGGGERRQYTLLRPHTATVDGVEATTYPAEGAMPILISPVEGSDGEISITRPTGGEVPEEILAAAAAARDLVSAKNFGSHRDRLRGFLRKSIRLNQAFVTQDTSEIQIVEAWCSLLVGAGQRRAIAAPVPVAAIAPAASVDLEEQIERLVAAARDAGTKNTRESTCLGKLAELDLVRDRLTELERALSEPLVEVQKKLKSARDEWDRVTEETKRKNSPEAKRLKKIGKSLALLGLTITPEQVANPDETERLIKIASSEGAQELLRSPLPITLPITQFRSLPPDIQSGFAALVDIGLLVMNCPDKTAETPVLVLDHPATEETK